jgi:hypothetical protein
MGSESIEKRMKNRKKKWGILADGNPSIMD